MSDGVKVLICLISIAGFSWWLAGTFKLPEIRGDSSAYSPIDYYANEMIMNVTDEQGNRKHQLVAHSMIHDEKKDVTELEKPIVTIFDVIKPPWVIRSETGTVSADGKKVFFGGTVYIDREASENTRPVNVVTKDLHVEPERRYAETDRRARILSQSDRVAGTGMRVFFSNPLKLTLLSNVKGKYETR